VRSEEEEDSNSTGSKMTAFDVCGCDQCIRFNGSMHEKVVKFNT
jgi:hypothetical protein